MDLPRLHELAMASPIGGIMPGASTRRSDIRRSGREPVSSSYPTTHRRAA